MRISEIQINEIHKVIKTFLIMIPYELYLYGSRTLDHLKGGDIDLLIITSEEGVSILNSNHLDLLVELKKQSSIGQRRIDLKFTTLQKLNSDPFLVSIKDQLVILH